MTIVEGDPYGPIKKPKQKVAPPPEEVNFFHTRGDTDSSQTAAHHTLGIKHDQASPGDHIHNGQNSKMIMEGVTITGSTSGNVALQNLITALSDAFGFVDGTT